MLNHTLYAAERSVASKACQIADLTPHGIAIAVELRLVREIGDVVFKENIAKLAYEKACWGWTAGSERRKSA